MTEKARSKEQDNHYNEKLRLLILGGSHLQVPAIKEARAMGLLVGVLDFDPHCPGRSLSDRFFLESTYDEEAVLKSAREFKPHGIVTLGTDRPMRSVAYASAALGLPAISREAAIRSTDKHEMSKAFQQNGVDHPEFLYFEAGKGNIEEVVNRIPLPIIVKPLDSSGSRGVVLVREPEKLAEAMEYSASFSDKGDVLIQEFMEGPEVSVEIIILRGEPIVLAITDKTTTGFPHFVETMHTEPSGLPEGEQSAIRRLAVKACQALGLDRGTAHVEIIVTKAGPKIVEVGPRMGGDYITTHLVPLSTGINMTRLMIQDALGEEPELPKRHPAGACIRYLEQHPGVFKGVENLDEVRREPNVVEAGIFIKEGHEMKELLSSVDRLGYIITQGDTAEMAYQANLRAQRKLRINIE